jgi:solute:Na+ symporter, SSS family
MHLIDWAILVFTLVAIFIYGFRQMHKAQLTDSKTYLTGERNLKWWTIGLSIMATQASAVTFLSTPGQAYLDGMEFGQFYFGLPLAMVLIAYFVLPIYYRLNVSTPYAYLEIRFGLPMRTLTAIIFLMLRGVSSAITLLAPSIVLSVALGWNLEATTLGMSVFVIAYTTLGGNEAVSRTQELQMTVMLLGLIAAFVAILFWLPELTLTEAWHIASLSGKTKIVDTSFSWSDRYNLWSGCIASMFLFLSYFGTDHSQVSRYLSGRSLKESRMGLLLNGLIKIPMQLLVLSVGVMVFVFYQLNTPPLHFNARNTQIVLESARADTYHALEHQHDSIAAVKAIYLLQQGVQASPQVVAQYDATIKTLRTEAASLIKEADPTLKSVNDADYIFIHFVLSQFPKGLIGFMLAMIFCAAWSTTASELAALTAVSIGDIYQRSLVPGRSDAHYLRAAKFSHILWGALLSVFALSANMFENLIQAVNMAGSVFYGTILGIFATAFFLKRVGGTAVFIGAVVAQAVVLWLFFGVSKDAYLWYIPLGTGLVMVVGLVVEALGPKSK